MVLLDSLGHYSKIFWLLMMFMAKASTISLTC